MTQQSLSPADSVSSRLPSALDPGTALAHQLTHKRPVMFLDYDGTLTPIVARPELALLDEAVRHTLAALAKRCPVAVVSGRDRSDVQRLVDIDGLIYAGSHGFDISDPGLQTEHGAAYLPDLDDAEAELRESLAHIRGALLERKTYSLAVHVRGLAPDAALAAEAAVDGALSAAIPAYARAPARWCSSCCRALIGIKARPFFTSWKFCGFPLPMCYPFTSATTVPTRTPSPP